MTEFTAAEVLAVHRETWDMPTFAERHPAMLEWIAERWGVLFPEDFTGQVYLYLVDLSDESQPVRKMDTTDVRVALEAVLVEEAAERLLESHGATSIEEALAEFWV